MHRLLATRAARKPYWTALSGYFLLAVLFYAPILVGLRTFPDGDFTHHFLPFVRFQLESLRAGQLPLWNPYTYAGHPFLADTQAAVFYPISNILLLITWPWTDAATRLYCLQVEAVIQVALAGFFVFLLVDELTRKRWAAFVAGCCFAFSGYLTGYPPLQLAVLRSAIWLPLLLWLLTRALDAPRHWRWWIASGVIGAVAMSAGHPQTLLYLVYTVAGYIVYRLWIKRPTSAGQGSPAARFLLPMGGLMAALLITLGLSAAQLWPSLEFAAQSVRANVDYAFVSGGLPLQDTWQILLPGVLTQFSPLYIGVVGLALAIVGVGSWITARGGLSPISSLQSPVSNLQSPISNLQSPIPAILPPARPHRPSALVRCEQLSLSALLLVGAGLALLSRAGAGRTHGGIGSQRRGRLRHGRDPAFGAAHAPAADAHHPGCERDRCLWLRPLLAIAWAQRDWPMALSDHRRGDAEPGGSVGCAAAPARLE